jgi:cytochrome c peroxidase
VPRSLVRDLIRPVEPLRSSLSRLEAKQESDRLVFKVPSLRNIDKTQPYFHTGKVATLQEAVKEMGEYQLGKRLNDDEIASIATLLKTRTGAIPADYIKLPPLPKSAAKTPKPSNT